MRWEDIYKLNVDKIGSNPDLIQPGVDLNMPTDAQSMAAGVTDGGKFVVHSGDNLWNISAKVLGSGTRWGEIYKLNADVIGNNPRLIMPGQELTLPGSPASNLLANANPQASAAATAPVAATPPGAASSLSAQTAALDAGPALHAPQNVAAQVSAESSQGLPVSTAPEGVLHGPGGAQAANLDTAATAASGIQPPGDKSVVSPSLAPDLSFFKRKT
jgi:hypothetical protein